MMKQLDDMKSGSLHKESRRMKGRVQQLIEEKQQQHCLTLHEQTFNHGCNTLPKLRAIRWNSRDHGSAAIEGEQLGLHVFIYVESTKRE
jgi:hypothetical protein